MPSTENTDPGRIRSGGERVYGIRITLPENDTFKLVLGDDWAGHRWYASEPERDAAFVELQREHDYSRLGDAPTHIYEKVSRDKPPAPEQRSGA
ncbi:MAG: hypothetical protein HKN49_09880 [Gammaproteobacteria bacterium]|nr:hypothetical protein [Gammaproteobacteria bacterium]